jgi:hypothetical protein
MKASYTGFNDLNAPNFGDISILAKGKLIQNANKTFSFEQMNEKCDDKCQTNADKFLENVTALWMVERIRHRDRNEHRFDLKFTIVPINKDIENIDHNNILEHRLKNHMKKSYILRDSDYPKYFGNRRTDLFNINSGFSRSLSSLMNPNNMLHTLLGLNISPPQQASLTSDHHQHQHNQQSPQQLKEVIKDARLNTGEFYMGTKMIPQNQKLNYHSTSANVLAPGNLKMVKFPESQEQFTIKHPKSHQHQQQRGQRPKAEIYHRIPHHNAPAALVDPRGTSSIGDNVHVGSIEHQNFHYYHQQHHPQQPQINLPKIPSPTIFPLYSVPIDMNIIQFPAAIPLSLQFSTPTNPQNLWIPQPEATTFRYPHNSQQLIQQQQIQYLPLAALQKPPKSQQPMMRGSSERHTAVNHQFSRPDPMYHHQSLSSGVKTEATTSHSTRQNNYANVNSGVRQNTASSIQVNKYDDEEDSDFKPITPMYDIRKYKNNLRFHTSATTTMSPITSTTTKKPHSQKLNSFNHDSAERGSNSNSVTILPTIIVKHNEKENEIGYRVLAERTTMSTTEKPILKWMPKSNNKKKNANQTVVVTPIVTSFQPTIIPNETTTSIITTTTSPTTRSISTKTSQQQFFRGKNRFNGSKRNSTSSLLKLTTTISPTSSEYSSVTTKLSRKKSPNSNTSQLPSLTSSTTIFPAYVTVTPIPMTDEPVTVQSLSTSISFEVNGEQQTTTTTTPAYEVVSAGVEVIKTNSSNVKLFQASVVPEKFDDLTFSILSHAKALEEDDRLVSAVDDDDYDSNINGGGNGLKKKV